MKTMRSSCERRREKKKERKGEPSDSESPGCPRVYTRIYVCRLRRFTKLSYARRSRINYSYKTHQSFLHFLFHERSRVFIASKKYLSIGKGPSLLLPSDFRIDTGTIRCRWKIPRHAKPTLWSLINFIPEYIRRKKQTIIYIYVNRTNKSTKFHARLRWAREASSRPIHTGNVTYRSLGSIEGFAKHSWPAEWFHMGINAGGRRFAFCFRKAFDSVGDHYASRPHTSSSRAAFTR